MRHKSNLNNLFLVAFFAVFVLVLIGASLTLKFIGIIRESNFDGEHRFTVFLADQSGNSVYLSVDPVQNSSTKLMFKNKVNREQVITTLPVAVDGIVVVSGKIDPSDSLISLLQSMLVKKNTVRNDITGIDLLRMYFFAKKTPSENRHEEEIHFSPNKLFEISFSDLFSDGAILKEEKTIAIENASTKSGVGSRVEDLLLVLGGNVVSLETSPVASPSSAVVYYEKSSHTTEKLVKLLNYPLEKTDKIGVADISIIIGEDGFDNLVFPK